MDTDQQIRLDFLEEADEYFNSLESLLMDLESQGAEPSLLDTAMRAAHSLKGGAAMMQFKPLSKIAHRLEDFLKILRVRKDNSLVDREVTTLLLQGVDCLREVRNLHQQDTVIDEDWLSNYTDPVFERLRGRLGDLKDEDEDLLLAEEEQVDVATLIFQSGVEECLESFRGQIEVLAPPQLKEELAMQAEQLAEFGQMSLIEPFVELCESVKQRLAVVSLNEIKALAQEALKLWERSHALVLVGRIDKLPTRIGSTLVDDEPTSEQAITTPDIQDIIDPAELQAIQNFTAQELATGSTELDFDEFIPDAAELLALDEAMKAMAEVENVNSIPLDLDALTPDLAELSALNAAIAAVDTPVVEAEVTQIKPIPAAKNLKQTIKEQGRMVKIPVEQLQRLNDLSSRLILERNAANLRLKQLQNFVGLTRERMRRLEQSSNQLRKLYDWASLEGMIPTTQPQALNIGVPWQISTSSIEEKFDALEMDRYSDLHLLSQEQMETIVQLQEVTTDIDLGIQEMGQVIRNLNYTTHELQQNITRSQMRPFAELVGRLPRMIRDLSSKHQKPVELIITGETTYIDRQALELLSDPLTHLLRNAFDHGIEPTETRIAAGKPAEGTITLNAAQKGNQTVITITDDGGGINIHKIRDRFIRRGFSQAEIDKVSETDLLDAIFEPGFSTADEVTELSGRGVGMDVVRSNLKQIRGDIQVSTELGKGTTFTITVPLSLLVLRVVIVESMGMVFAVPVYSIKEIIRFHEQAVIKDAQTEHISWNNQSIPLWRLEKYLRYQRPSSSFEMQGTAKIPTPTVLIFEDNTSLQGIYLEKYWNEQEVAIRPVKTSIALFPGFTGSTILGDGRVIPLIEPSILAKGLAKQQRASFTTLSTSVDIPLENSTFAVFDQSTVLVVDDSVNVRRYLAGILERNGYRVEEAKDGRDAVDKLQAGLQVKAVICDVEMPRLDGYGVLSEVKTEPHLEHIPIAMLTSRSNDKHRQLAMKLGASAYFSKPFNEQEMLQVLGGLVSQQNNN
ncbi:CheA signal transduction histidine kinase [Chondrocystis sp. NIES-4102]|nr:CheA signal transduction histidine kinase [Chondrocystis sp. NIES-4102]